MKWFASRGVELFFCKAAIGIVAVFGKLFRIINRTDRGVLANIVIGVKHFGNRCAIGVLDANDVAQVVIFVRRTLRRLSGYVQRGLGGVAIEVIAVDVFYDGVIAGTFLQFP